MGVQVSIGDFSIMTSLSRRALRHYHELGLLEPAHVDRSTGYRFYDTGQVEHAHIIRRFRALGMSIPDVKALLSTDEIAVRNEIITAHLQRMEQQLHETQEAVGALRELLDPDRAGAQVEQRHEADTTVWALSAQISLSDIDTWFSHSIGRLRRAVEAAGAVIGGPTGGLYERELFSETRGRATLFIPTDHALPAPPEDEALVVPAADVAVVTHRGSHDNIDRSYGALGTYVHEHLIARDGPIRERYFARPGAQGTDFSHTEICWPVVRTAL